MELKKAGIEDFGLLLENRVMVANIMRPIENKDEFREHTRIYLQKHISDGTILPYIALDDGEIVSSCILCIYETLPTPSCPSGKFGLLINVHTEESYRRRGLSYTHLSMLIEEARSLGVGRIQLTYTDAGYPLYVKLGFEKAGRDMILKL
jgi:GNAT superfamily N-acetyltransferase